MSYEEQLHEDISAPLSERAATETVFRDLINSATTVDDLVAVIRTKFIIITEGEQTYGPHNLIHIILQVAEKTMPLSEIPETYGLRAKVAELLK